MFLFQMRTKRPHCARDQLRVITHVAFHLSRCSTNRSLMDRCLGPLKQFNAWHLSCSWTQSFRFCYLATVFTHSHCFLFSQPLDLFSLGIAGPSNCAPSSNFQAMWHNLRTMLLRQVRTLSSPCLFYWICTLKISSATVNIRGLPLPSHGGGLLLDHQALTVEELTANHLCLGSAHTPQARECSTSFYIIILSSFFKFQP